MLLVVERRQSRRLPGAVRSERQRAIKQRKRRLRFFSSARRARDFRHSQLIVSTRLSLAAGNARARAFPRRCTRCNACGAAEVRVELHLCTWSQREESSAAT